MKKLLLTLAVATLSVSSFASSDLDQLKMKRVEGVYIAELDLKHTEYLERFSTPELKKLIKKARKHDATISSEDAYDGAACLWGAYIYGGGQDSNPSKPSFKIQGNDVYITLRQFYQDPETKKTIKYNLKCDSKQCLIDDFKVAGYEYSFKKMLKMCTSN